MKNSTSENQTDRKWTNLWPVGKKKFEAPRRKEISFPDFKIWRPTFFEVPFYNPNRGEKLRRDDQKIIKEEWPRRWSRLIEV